MNHYMITCEGIPYMAGFCRHFVIITDAILREQQ